MEKLRFEFTVKAKEEDSKSNILCLTSITTPTGEVYNIPTDLQPVSTHTELIKTETFKKVKNINMKRHEKQNVWINLNDSLKKIYLDDSENVQFANLILEERCTQTKITSDISQGDLAKIVENFSKMESNRSKRNLNKLAEKFVLDKFTSKTNNVTQWMELFESECERLILKEDIEKIEILRLFLEGSCIDWYSSMLMKLTINSEWTNWKNNFCETYADKGWSPVKYAISFKYKNGPLLDYALKKEKLILEIDKSIHSSMLINLIAAGLPDFVTNKINRSDMNEPKDLFNEIRSLEHLVRNNIYDKEKNRFVALKNKKEKKVACKICEEKGKKNRYHSEDSCWFKTTPNPTKEDNKIKLINNSQLEYELQEDNSKN